MTIFHGTVATDVACKQETSLSRTPGLGICILGFATYMMGTPMILPFRVCPFDYTAFVVSAKVGIP